MLNYLGSGYKPAHQMRAKRNRAKKAKSLAFKDFFYVITFLLILTGTLNVIKYRLDSAKPVKTVKAASETIVAPLKEKIITKTVQGHAKEYDIWVGESVDKFFSGERASEMRMVMHCLLSRESKHGQDEDFGDGGLAHGPLQFHQATWEDMRTNMIKDGFADTIGDRDNMQQAIDTTVYAIYKGRGLEWGPLLREARGGTLPKCPLPSWY